MSDQDREGHLVTRSGTPLTPEYEERLTAEAEAGFDPSDLVRRRAGRPSLSGGTGRSSRLDVRVDDEMREALNRLAAQQQRKVSDIVREALRSYVSTR